MSIEASEWIWMSGQWKRWHEATVHVSAHALHYGSSVFEGIRAYETPEGPAIFRLREHIRRLFNSAKLIRMDLAPYNEDDLMAACVELIRRNGHDACYVRPIAFRGAGSLGVDPRACPAEVVLMSMEWGRYLGPEAIEQGVDAAISSWRRPAPGTMSALGKIGGQYVNNQFVSVEARLNGFTEGLVLDQNGMVCEGGGENVFAIFDGCILTPSMASSILAGITRDTVLTLAADLDIPVRFESLSRDMLYLADEMFLSGTAAEITPVRSVDHIAVGNGSRGPITERLQREFFAITSGQQADPHDWMTPIARPMTVPVGAAVAMGA